MMPILKNQHTFELEQKQERLSPLVLFLLNHKSFALKKGVFITDEFISLLDSFAERNSIAITDEIILHKCCPACFKAFMLKITRELSFDETTRQYMREIFPGEVGHIGYYLDKGNLCKC